jgi:hypothetical protein
MAKNAADAVIQLSKTGQLRAMFAGLTAGMRPLSRLPAQIITGLTQISIAASPAFARLTTAAANAAGNISKKLGGAFKSGALETAINAAVDIAKQFGQLLGDIGGTISNILKAAAAGGGDALGTLGSVFAELRRDHRHAGGAEGAHQHLHGHQLDREAGRGHTRRGDRGGAAAARRDRPCDH